MTLSTPVYDIFFEKIQSKVFQVKLNRIDVPLKSPKEWKNIDIKDLEDVFGKGIADQQYFYRIYNAAHNALPKGECQVRDDVICKSLEFLGYSLPADNNISGVADKARELYGLFYNDIKSSFLNRSKVSDQYRAIIENLVTNKWVYCYRKHLTPSQRRDPYSWMDWNQMVFEMESPSVVKVTKVATVSANSSGYSDVIGYIDFEGSHENVLNINLKNITEHCHIKLNIRGVAKRSLYVSQFLQSESDGHLGAGSALLLQIPNLMESGEHQFISKQAEEDADYVPEDLPEQFKDIFFYFKEVRLNTLRATNDPITSVEGLNNWKKQWEDKRVPKLRKNGSSFLPH